jgi:uncharacterized membrane protein YheB (UPF0754 family)
VNQGVAIQQSILADVTAHWWMYVSMPLIAALIGYVTKLVAVEMMFRPLEFRGIPPYLGWQGVLPRVLGRMAAIVCNTLAAHLVDPRELFDLLDPREIAKELHEPLVAVTSQLVEEVLDHIRPGLGASLPDTVKRQIVEAVGDSAPEVLAEVMRRVREDVNSVFDFTEMALTGLVRDKVTLTVLMRDAGSRVFRFIVRFGIPSGFAIGLIQAVSWALFKEPMIMPLFGLITGWLTDYLALRLVFVPKFPTRYLGLFNWQGLFFRYREEFTENYANLIAQRVITARDLVQALMHGPMSDRLLAVAQGAVEDELRRRLGFARPLLALTTSANSRQEIRELTSQVVRQRLPEFTSHLERYIDETLDIRALIKSKMREMTADEFEQLLRPAFRQDEWKIVAVGAVLGFLVGELQIVLVEHLGG